MGAVGAVTSTGALSPGDMREHLQCHVGELLPLQGSYLSSTGDQTVLSLLPHKVSNHAVASRKEKPEEGAARGASYT